MQCPRPGHATDGTHTYSKSTSSLTTKPPTQASTSDSQIGRHVLRGADGVVPLFRSEPRFAIRSTILQDYIEEVVFYLYGADRAPDMIRCLGCRGSDCQR